jgi:hypothetical protein
MKLRCPHCGSYLGHLVPMTTTSDLVLLALVAGLTLGALLGTLS